MNQQTTSTLGATAGESNPSKGNAKNRRSRLLAVMSCCFSLRRQRRAKTPAIPRRPRSPIQLSVNGIHHQDSATATERCIPTAPLVLASPRSFQKASSQLDFLWPAGTAPAMHRPRCGPGPAGPGVSGPLRRLSVGDMGLPEDEIGETSPLGIKATEVAANAAAEFDISWATTASTISTRQHVPQSATHLSYHSSAPQSFVLSAPKGSAEGTQAAPAGHFYRSSLKRARNTVKPATTLPVMRISSELQEKLAHRMKMLSGPLEDDGCGMSLQPASRCATYSFRTLYEQRLAASRRSAESVVVDGKSAARIIDIKRRMTSMEKEGAKDASAETSIKYVSTASYLQKLDKSICTRAVEVANPKRNSGGQNSNSRLSPPPLSEWIQMNAESSGWSKSRNKPVRGLLEEMSLVPDSNWHIATRKIHVCD